MCKWYFTMVAVAMMLAWGVTADAQRTAGANRGRDRLPKGVKVATVSMKSNGYAIGGKRFTAKGNFDVNRYDASATGKVTFTAFPANYDEFKNVYENYLGKTPEGTVAMATMAMELYFRDKATGERCIDLICSTGCASSFKRGVGDKARAVASGDSYGQRYLPAAVLSGASHENGYRPSTPYTIEMMASVNKHQRLSYMGNGTVMYVWVLAPGGWDSYRRGVQVLLEDGAQLYKVFSASDLYVQCRNISGRERFEPLR